MYPEERQHAIATLVTERGRLAVTAVAEQFGVTTETVRRDLALLERAGMLRRVHGGAVPAGALTLVETGLGERHGTRTEAKRAIAAAALDLLPGTDGSVILDGGSTTAALADVLPADRRLYVATNSVPIAARLSASPGITLHVLGGRVRGITQTAVGDATIRALRRPPRRRRLPRRQRDQPRARLQHARRGRGGHEARDGPGRAAGDRARRQQQARPRAPACASPPWRTSTSSSPTARPIPASSQSSRRLGIEVVVA